jgi:hypothetical protein
MRSLPTIPARALLSAAAIALFASPLPAQSDDQAKDQAEAPDRPITEQKSPTAKQIAVSPLADLNLKKDPIPQLLLDAQMDPYGNVGFKKCTQYAAAIEDLDAVLGPDFDVATPEQRKITTGQVAQAVVSALIPFRGVIREVSGASKHERQWRDAIMAGVMRRAFLKGMGLKLGCNYPARPADDATRAKYAAAYAESQRKEKDDDKDDKGN